MKGHAPPTAKKAHEEGGEAARLSRKRGHVCEGHGARAVHRRGSTVLTYFLLTYFLLTYFQDREGLDLTERFLIAVREISARSRLMTTSNGASKASSISRARCEATASDALPSSTAASSGVADWSVDWLID